jgi:hypothetical protein
VSVPAERDGPLTTVVDWLIIWLRSNLTTPRSIRSQPMRIPKPNATLILAVAVLVLAFNGTAIAASVTRVVLQGTGPGATSAVVDKGGQILSTDTPPHDIVSFLAISSSNCTSVYTVPVGKALVIKQVNFSMSSSGGVAADLAFYTGTGQCTEFTGIEGRTATNQSVDESLGPGVVLPARTSLTLLREAGDGYALVTGYLISSAAASSAGSLHVPAGARPVGSR